MSEIEHIQAGIAAHQAGDADSARREYRAALDIAPDNPDALHFMGLLTVEAGDVDEGMRLIRRSLRIHPENPGALNNLGNTLRAAGDVEGALRAYRDALEIVPDHRETLFNLSGLLVAEARSEEALQVIDRALSLDPANEQLRRQRAGCLLQTGRRDEAVALLEDIVSGTEGPLQHAVWYARVLAGLGRETRAAEVLRRWLAEHPGDPVAGHQLAALEGDGAGRAPDAYVRAHFDDFAENFDATLGRLGYAAPGFVAELALSLTGDARLDEIVDLGCGTGLCGPLVRSACARLVGVDLSPEMLKRAETTGVYDDLIEAELIDYLSHRADARLAMAISADTLCYFGDLDSVFSALARSLAPNGVLVATVETLPGAGSADITLQPSGRYAHTRAYLQQCAELTGLDLIHLENVILRSELGRPVHGLVFALQRMAE